MDIQRSRYSAPYLPEIFFSVFWEQRRKRGFLSKWARLVVPRLERLYLPLPMDNQDAPRTRANYIALTLSMVEIEVNEQLNEFAYWSMSAVSHATANLSESKGVQQTENETDASLFCDSCVFLSRSQCRTSVAVNGNLQQITTSLASDHHHVRVPSPFPLPFTNGRHFGQRLPRKSRSRGLQRHSTLRRRASATASARGGARVRLARRQNRSHEGLFTL